MASEIFRSARVLPVFLVIMACAFLLPIMAFGAAPSKTIGVVMTCNIPYYKDMHKAFTDGLVSEGMGPENVEIILQTPSPEPMSWTNAVRKLIAVGADIIVCYGAPATLTALAETSEVPVVFAGVYDPQGLGISWKNAAGISSKVSVSGMLKNLKDISHFSTIGVVYSESEKDTVLQAREVKQLEAYLSFKASKFNFKRQDDLSKISGVDALFLTTGCAAMRCVGNITDIARRAKIPVCAVIGGGESSGIILTLSANPQEQGREAAKIAARVAKGVKPAMIPLAQPKKVDLIINLKEAAEMGLRIPVHILTSATRVIQ